MHYTTVTVDILVPEDASVEQAIDDAIMGGLKTLSEEINGPVELVNVVPVPVPNLLCLTIMAKPYQPVRVTPDLGIKVPYGGIALQ
jgi:hypothetical protein